MKNLFAWASIGENGRATGGKKGDQTGKEVKVGEYYDFGQTCVVRFTNVSMGRSAAKIAKIIASDNSVGYNQSERHTLFNACANLNWNIEKVKKAIKEGKFPKCNTDCSAFVATCINLAYGKKLVTCFATGNMISETVMKHPTEFRKIDLATAKKKWHKGDMPMKIGHVIINI